MRPDPWIIRLPLVATIVALAVAVACGGGSSTPTPTASPSPTPTQLVLTPGPTAEPPVTDYRLVFRESTPTEDVIWSVSPADVTQRQEIARIEHREGFPIVPAISPDGAMLAYLSQPDFAVGADSSQAEAFLIDLQSEDKTPVKIADGIDYRFAPMWAPDGGLLYMRRYAGPEFLAASVSIVRSRILPSSTTPTPTPSPVPGIAPWPGIESPETVLLDTVAHVLKFSPLGFEDDGKSMFFLQEQGGTEGGTLVGIFSPATTKEVDRLHKMAEDAWYAAQATNLQAAQDAANNGQPAPVDTVTPAPTPSPDNRFVVQLSNQAVTGASLSPDTHKVAYLNQSFTDAADILNRTWVADLIAATAAPLPLQGLPAGDELTPVWYPDGRLTISVLPEDGGPGQMAIVALDLTSIAFLAQPDAGFDIPRGWAPDGTWLAVSHQSGTSVASPGDGRLDIVSTGGQRITVIGGSANSGEGSVLGWIKPSAETPAG